MKLTVTGNNMFHLGWLTCFLGMPRVYPGLPDGMEKDSFNEGWDMCNETSPEWRIKALQPMIDKGQAIVAWSSK